MTAELRVLIVDDEELARLRLRTLVSECPEPRALVLGEAANTAQALAWLSAHECDVVLLDIHMPGPDGIQLAATLRQKHNSPSVVFVTAYAEHALKAFELDAVDYLTKPVRRERLQAALSRVAQRRQASVEQRLGTRVAEATVDAELSPVIIVSDLGRKIRVPVSDVLYLKAELKYVTLRTATHTHVLDDALTDLEQRLGERFLRIHRNALVARKALRALERRVLPGDSEDEAADTATSEVAAAEAAAEGASEA